MFPEFAIAAGPPINERNEEMDEKQNKARKVGDIHISPARENEGLVIRQVNGGYAPAEMLAAFTNPAEMIAWLAEQYGVEIKPRGAPSRSANLAATEILAGFAAYGKHPAIKALEEAEAPRYQWKTREDFVAALTMALTVRGYPASMAPGQHARGIADVIDSVHAQGIGE